jgi:hypothetical protein
MSSISNRIQLTRLSSLAAAAVLLSCCVAAPASARSPKQPSEPTPASDTIALELRESGETARTIEFIVPVNGRIAGWTELYGERHYCRLDSEQIADSRISLRMQCGKARQLQQLDFDFTTIRSLEPGAPTLLAEFTPRAADRLQVIATRR